MILTFLFAMCGVAWNIMGGYAGMFSFGQAAFFGIGAYTSSFLLLTFRVSPWIGLVAGGMISVAAWPRPSATRAPSCAAITLQLPASPSQRSSASFSTTGKWWAPPKVSPFPC